MLDWRTAPSSNPNSLEDGAELEVCFPEGFHNRSAIYSVRFLRLVRDPAAPGGGFTQRDPYYRVRDADTVSDEDVFNGVRPAIAGEFDTLDAAMGFINERR